MRSSVRAWRIRFSHTVVYFYRLPREFGTRTTTIGISFVRTSRRRIMLVVVNITRTRTGHDCAFHKPSFAAFVLRDRPCHAFFSLMDGLDGVATASADIQNGNEQ